MPCLFFLFFLFFLCLATKDDTDATNGRRWYKNGSTPAGRSTGERQGARGVSTCCAHRLMAVYILMSEPTSAAESML